MEPYYDDGQVALYCGDWRQVLPGLAPASVDVVMADPPYNIGFSYGAYRDDLPEWAYRCGQLELAACAATLLKPGGAFWWLNFPEKAAWFWEAVPGATTHLRQEDWLTWVYHPLNAGGSYLRRAHRAWLWFSKGEPTLAGAFTGEYQNATDRRILRRLANGERPKARDWWEDEQVKNVSTEKTEHPCQLPVEMVRWLLAPFPRGLVVDPYAGSGTTLRAAKDLGCRAIGVEIDPDYCDIAVRRLAQQSLPLTA